jgi:hypothetical protein
VKYIWKMLGIAGIYLAALVLDLTIGGPLMTIIGPILRGLGWKTIAVT